MRSRVWEPPRIEACVTANDVGVARKRVRSLLNLGHANVLLMIRIGICRLPRFCGWGVGV
jgi:hypothetical protein